MCCSHKTFVVSVLLLSCRWNTIIICFESCPSCGNMSVPYPLSTSAVGACGRPEYRLNCTAAQQLELVTTTGSYPILSIDAASRLIVVAPAELTGSSCVTPDLVNGGFELDPNLDFNLSSRNTVMLLNCTSVMLQSPLNCSATSPCRQFAETVAAANGCGNDLCCSFESGPTTAYKIPLSSQECSAYTSVIDLDPMLPPSEWSYGIEIQWQVPLEPSCRTTSDCETNSTCMPDPATNTLKCLCNSAYHWDSVNGYCVLSLTCGVTALLLGYAVLTWIFRRKRQQKLTELMRFKEFSSRLSHVNGGGKYPRVFTTKEMRKATNGFSKDRVLGSGGFGEVYKGIIDGTVIAVKSAKLGNLKGINQVINEVCILSQVNHRNLVRLLGCCVDLKQPLLIYEYVPNGNLFEHLHKSRGVFLDWKTRLQIALQTAEGLAYLHFAAYPSIYHRDIKSSNILLDNLLNARVSDFGLSTLASPDLSHISTTVQGTLGYLDPSYYHNFQLTDKSDVYSFGVVLLELVSSQRAIDFSREQDDVNLAIYAKTKSEKGKLLELIDPELIATAAPKIVDTMIGVTLLALNCLEDKRVNRPTMKEVVEELLFIISVEETESDAIPKAIITRSGDGDEDEDPAEPSGHAVEDPEETTAEEAPLSCDSTILDQLSDHCL
ncbi:unnamed protein product [Sphagnum troendelagicum]|uniref:Protein kinase domain-containing protein n=1 Tax=Sphagnum troendelagicum TaxID=128251 RepID=A0ABP0UMH8_9BRYO